MLSVIRVNDVAPKISKDVIGRDVGIFCNQKSKIWSNENSKKFVEINQFFFVGNDPLEIQTFRGVVKITFKNFLI
jgi:hypothetical protein